MQQAHSISNMFETFIVWVWSKSLWHLRVVGLDPAAVILKENRAGRVVYKYLPD